jgi:hypothetical protein
MTTRRHKYSARHKYSVFLFRRTSPVLRGCFLEFFLAQIKEQDVYCTNIKKFVKNWYFKGFTSI